MKAASSVIKQFFIRQFVAHFYAIKYSFYTTSIYCFPLSWSRELIFCTAKNSSSSKYLSFWFKTIFLFHSLYLATKRNFAKQNKLSLFSCEIVPIIFFSNRPKSIQYFLIFFLNICLHNASYKFLFAATAHWAPRFVFATCWWCWSLKGCCETEENFNNIRFFYIRKISLQKFSPATRRMLLSCVDDRVHPPKQISFIRLYCG